MDTFLQQERNFCSLFCLQLTLLGCLTLVVLALSCSITSSASVVSLFSRNLPWPNITKNRIQLARPLVYIEKCLSHNLLAAGADLWGPQSPAPQPQVLRSQNLWTLFNIKIFLPHFTQHIILYLTIFHNSNSNTFQPHFNWHIISQLMQLKVKVLTSGLGYMYVRIDLLDVHLSL